MEMEMETAQAAAGGSGIGCVQHISLCIRNEAEARAFYTGTLGLEEAKRPNLPMDGLWLQVGPMQVHLLVPFDTSELPRPRTLKGAPVAAHTAFEVSSLEPIVSKLRALGVAVVSSPFIETQVFLTDPSGNILELNAPVMEVATG